jgi:hypothetical protein
MTRMGDPLKIVTDLRPAALDHLIEHGYAQHRDADLARAAADRAVHRPPARRRRSRAGPGRPYWYLVAGIAVTAAAAAVAAVVLAGVPSAARPRTSPSAAVPSAAAGAQRFLLASAAIAAQAPVATGTYWYIRTRDFWPSVTIKKKSYGAIVASTAEDWYGQIHARETHNEDVSFSFVSAADEARWQAAGKPLLATESSTFGSTRPETRYFAQIFWPVPGDFQALSLREMRQLPATEAGLRAMVLRMWNGPDETELKQGIRGPARPTYDSFLVGWANVILTGPTMPGTKAAIYQLLAGRPGLKIISSVTDPLGRTGIAVTDGRIYLLIDPQTAQPLALTEQPVHANSVISAAQGVVRVFEEMGWTNKIGVPPQS